MRVKRSKTLSECNLKNERCSFYLKLINILKIFFNLMFLQLYSQLINIYFKQLGLNIHIILI